MFSSVTAAAFFCRPNLNAKHMQNERQTAGETAITLVIMRDCHVRHNEEVNTTADKFELYRRLAAKRGWLMGMRKGGAV